MRISRLSQYLLLVLAVIGISGCQSGGSSLPGFASNPFKSEAPPAVAPPSQLAAAPAPGAGYGATGNTLAPPAVSLADGGTAPPSNVVPASYPRTSTPNAMTLPGGYAGYTGAPATGGASGVAPQTGPYGSGSVAAAPGRYPDTSAYDPTRPGTGYVSAPTGTPYAGSPYGGGDDRYSEMASLPGDRYGGAPTSDYRGQPASNYNPGNTGYNPPGVEPYASPGGSYVPPGTSPSTTPAPYRPGGTGSYEPAGSTAPGASTAIPPTSDSGYGSIPADTRYGGAATSAPADSRYGSGADSSYGAGTGTPTGSSYSPPPYVGSGGSTPSAYAPQVPNDTRYGSPAGVPPAAYTPPGTQTPPAGYIPPTSNPAPTGYGTPSSAPTGYGQPMGSYSQPKSVGPSFVGTSPGTPGMVLPASYTNPTAPTVSYGH